MIAALGITMSCTGREVPQTPLQTFKTYTRAIKAKDTTTMKLLLSSESIKMHEQEAKAQGVTVDDIVKRETLFTADQTSVEFRNEKIEGDKATLEVKKNDSWVSVPFVKEDGVWKIDNKGFTDQILTDEQKSSQQIDQIVNQGRQP